MFILGLMSGIVGTLIFLSICGLVSVIRDVHSIVKFKIRDFFPGRNSAD